MGENVLRSVVIKGADVTDEWHNALPAQLTIEHIALDNISYSGTSMAFKDAAIQLTDWENSDAPWGNWQGQFLFSSPLVEIDGLPMSNLLLDSERAKESWEIWGISFNSQWGNITGSATLSDSRQWLFHQLTLSDAQLEYSSSLERVIDQWQDFTKNNVVSFRRLDLLDISASFETFTVEHLNASLQGLVLEHGKPMLADIDALLSFNASLIRYQDWVMTDILSDVSLDGNDIDINAFSTKIADDGFISFAGKLNTTALSLNNLVISGMSLNAEDPILQSTFSALQQLNDVRVNNMTVKHTNVLYLDKRFPLQVVGLNLRGQNVVLKQAGKPGLWQGQLSASAASASVNRIPVSSPYFSMESHKGNWQIDPLSLSFIQGQFAAKAHIDLSRQSVPWKVTVTGLSVPNDIYARWLSLPIEINGEHDIALSLSGLADNEDSFAYSLSGELTATPHRLWLHADSGQSLSQSVLSALQHQDNAKNQNQRPLTISNIQLKADRGRISLAPVVIKEHNQSVNLSGRWDLVSGEADLEVSKK